MIFLLQIQRSVQIQRLERGHLRLEFMSANNLCKSEFSISVERSSRERIRHRDGESEELETVSHRLFVSEEKWRETSKAANKWTNVRRVERGSSAAMFIVSSLLYSILYLRDFYLPTR